MVPQKYVWIMNKGGTKLTASTLCCLSLISPKSEHYQKDISFLVFVNHSEDELIKAASFSTKYKIHGNFVRIIKMTSNSINPLLINYQSLPIIHHHLQLKYKNFHQNKMHLQPLLFQLQGAIMVASCFQIFVGFSGLIGFLMRFIGPLTIAPTITLVALPLFSSAGKDAGEHWGIAAM